MRAFKQAKYFEFERKPNGPASTQPDANISFTSGLLKEIPGVGTQRRRKKGHRSRTAIFPFGVVAID